MDLPNKDVGCHHTGFTKKCHMLVTGGICNRWIQVQGHNANTGETINRYDCVDNWLPTLTIENSQMQRQTAAAVESFRNKMIDAQFRVAELMEGAVKAAFENRALPPKRGRPPKAIT